MSTKDPHSIARAMEELRLLIQQGIITQFGADFTGNTFVATVMITAQDELSAARVKRTVKRVLDPNFPDAKVVIRRAVGGKDTR